MPFEKYIPNPGAIRTFFQKAIKGALSGLTDGGLPIEEKTANPPNTVPIRPDQGITYVTPSEAIQQYAKTQITPVKRKRRYTRRKPQKRRRTTKTSSRKRTTRKRSVKKKPIESQLRKARIN